jgi:Zn-dependent M16 (insulinase) family peptidase
MTELKISDEEIERLLNEISKSENAIERRISYRPFRDMMLFVIANIKKNGYITSAVVAKRFGVSLRWASIKLRDFVYLELLIGKNMIGSNMTEFRAVLDETGEPKIYKYYEKSKE